MRSVAICLPSSCVVPPLMAIVDPTKLIGSAIFFLTSFSKMGIYPHMAFVDYIWLIKLIIELLRILGRTDKDDLEQISKGIQNLRDLSA